MSHEEIHLRLVGRIRFMAYEDEQDIRLSHIRGCDFEFDGIDPFVEAALWLADQLRKRGVEIRGRRAWAGSRRKIHRHKIPGLVGLLTVDLARDLENDKVLFRADLYGFDSPSCDKFKDGDLYHLVSEFVNRADMLIRRAEPAKTIFDNVPQGKSS